MNHSEHYVFLGYSMKKTVGKGVQWEEKEHDARIGWQEGNSGVLLRGVCYFCTKMCVTYNQGK